MTTKFPTEIDPIDPLPSTPDRSDQQIFAIQTVIGVTGSTDENSIMARLAALEAEVFEAEAIPYTRVLPRVIEFLRRLPRLGLRTGIVTSNATEVVTAILKRDGVMAAFSATIGRGHGARVLRHPVSPAARR